MSARQPPRLARWLAEHLGSRYQRESLVGDLFEEYAAGRSRLWYWKQVALVLLYGGVMSPVLATMRALGSILPDSVTSLLRRLTKRLVAVLAVTALGVGTLTWAATTYTPSSCSTQSTSCHKAR